MIVMAALETLNEADIKQVVGNSSLKKARGYLNRVSNGVRNGRSLRAEVRGSRLYSVEIDVAQDGIHAVCSCPYDWSGYCKHIAAVLPRMAFLQCFQVGRQVLDHYCVGNRDALLLLELVHQKAENQRRILALQQLNYSRLTQAGQEIIMVHIQIIGKN
jgi:uncharacterized Zn finger protein